MASRRFGISGTTISRILEGKCVNTIVFTSPIREARRDAKSAESPAKHVSPEEDSSQRRWVHAEAKIEPIRREALHHEAPAKCVQRKQSGKPENHRAGVADAEQGLHFRRSFRSTMDLRTRGKPAEQDCEYASHRGIEEDHDALARRPPRLPISPAIASALPANSRSSRGCDGAGQRVPGKRGRSGGARRSPPTARPALWEETDRLRSR